MLMDEENYLELKSKICPEVKVDLWLVEAGWSWKRSVIIEECSCKDICYAVAGNVL